MTEHITRCDRCGYVIEPSYKPTWPQRSLQQDTSSIVLRIVANAVAIDLCEHCMGEFERWFDKDVQE